MDKKLEKEIKTHLIKHWDVKLIYVFSGVLLIIGLLSLSQYRFDSASRLDTSNYSLNAIVYGASQGFSKFDERNWSSSNKSFKIKHEKQPIDIRKSNKLKIANERQKTNANHYIGTFRVKNKFANVRIGPGKIFEVRKVLSRNMIIKVIEKRGKWLRIDQGNWISRKTLTELH